MPEQSNSLARSVIVVGSGFGGAVMAYRLAKEGYRVTILERGRKWTRFPRDPNDPWLYDSRRPEKWNGWVEFHVWRKMIVATGAGVGGGSLIYANVSAVAPESTFQKGWPREITYQGLQPFYETVGGMLGLEVLPDNQLNERHRLVKMGADAIGASDRFRKLPLAVRFGEQKPPRDAFAGDPSGKREPGQGTCVHCGNCDVGCQVGAKNTLDFNYLRLAQEAGAEILTLHQVEYVEPIAGGYRVAVWEIDMRTHTRRLKMMEAERVVLAAGSLGSTEILLRSRDQHRTLPDVSAFLGRNWSTNGDILTMARYKRDIDPSYGPTISCGIDYLEGGRPERYIIEDGGLPPVLRNYLLYKWGNIAARVLPPLRPIIRRQMEKVRGTDYNRHTMPWFANGVDAADGRLRLGRRWYTPWRQELMMDWDLKASRKMFDAVLARHKELIRATGGRRELAWVWDLFHTLITPHPLGGCNMGDTPATGVVNHAGEVFGYPGLYVADGAVVPEAVGLNPSRTIAAVAERIAAVLLEESRAPGEAVVQVPAIFPAPAVAAAEGDAAAPGAGGVPA